MFVNPNVVDFQLGKNLVNFCQFANHSCVNLRLTFTYLKNIYLGISEKLLILKMYEK